MSWPLDSVIAAAVDRMPAAYRERWGTRMVDALRQRRWLSFFTPGHRSSLAWASARKGDRWYLRWGLGS